MTSAMRVAALLAMVALPCFHDPAAAQATIRIGASLSLSGTYSEPGQAQERAYRVCIKQANGRGGVLGRPIELVIDDDRSDFATAVAIYEKLIVKEKAHAVFSPYSSPLTDAVANVTERSRMPMVAAGASATAIFKKGRKFLFMLLSPAEVYFEGFVDLAAKRGLKTIAVVYEDTIFPKASAQGTMNFAKKHGLRVVFAESYPAKAGDFAAIANKLRAANPDVIVVSSYFNDIVAMVRQIKDAGLSPRMLGLTSGADLPKFYEALGRNAEYVYGPTQWAPELVNVRAGGVIPVTRLYPGARQFAEEHEKQFPGAPLSYHSAGAFGACQIMLESIRRAGSLDPDRVRAEILKFDGNTVYGAFRVNAEGVQLAHKMLMFQWQEGRRSIVWPEELSAVPARFPNPSGSRRP